MILYRPTDGEIHWSPIRWRPRCAFMMVQLGGPVPEVVVEIRRTTAQILAEYSYSAMDADSLTTGKDFLLKIWQLALSVPLGIAIVHEGIAPSTIANLFYELGWMQAYGKETIVIRVGDVALPSDFVRTEYVPFDDHFERRFRSFLSGLQAQADYYATLADQVERNPLLAIDYFRRAYLLTGEASLRERAQATYAAAGVRNRARTSVEALLTGF
jgi:hypothetical protein